MTDAKSEMRIVRAVFLAPLSMVPVIWFVGFGIHLYDVMTIPNYRSYENIYISGIYILLYVVFIVGLITLIYGLPVYLLLNRFNKATLLNLVLAGAIPFVVLALALGGTLIQGLPLAALGALVAATFWLVATKHRAQMVVWVKRGMWGLLALMTGWWMIVLLVEAFIQ